MVAITRIRASGPVAPATFDTRRPRMLMQLGLEYCSAAAIIERRRGRQGSEFLVRASALEHHSRVLEAATCSFFLLSLATWFLTHLISFLLFLPFPPRLRSSPPQWEDGSQPSWEPEEHVAVELLLSFMDTAESRTPLKEGAAWVRRMPRKLQGRKGKGKKEEKQKKSLAAAGAA